MLLSATVIFALVGTALAAPAAVNLERRHPALALTQAIHQFEKRQSTSSTNQALSALQDLLGKAVTSTSSGGQCSSECSGWVNAVTDCTDLGSYTQIGYCACGDTPLSAMSTCGDCYGGSSTTDSDNFASFCKDALGSSEGISASAVASSRSQAASGTSYSSRASPTMILDTETYSARSTTSNPASAPQESASNAGSPSQAPGSGAGSVKVGLAMVAGVVGGAAVVLFV